MLRFRHVAIPVVTAAAITVATATSTFAATIDDQAVTVGARGIVGFSRDGDVFRILDVDVDGKGVRLQYTNPTTGTPSTSHTKVNVNYTGGYTGWDYDNAFVYNTNFDEDACFYFRAGLVDNGSYVEDTYGSWILACAKNG
ncbi:hypothetical protein ACWD3I_10555 [Streptomyces sp. NPDC002817]|uniref:hypothetical protein n=1 Tax=Streptomyces sp. NPDC088357 TaxID=3154655 RepID=UPI003433F28E